MTELFSESSTRGQKLSFSSVLMDAKYEKVKEEAEIRMFQVKDFAHDWDSVYINPPDISICPTGKGLRKVSEPVLVMMSHAPRMAFVMASEDKPVYFDSSFRRDKHNGYLLLFRLRPHVLPEYIFYMSKYNSWTGVSKELDIMSMYDKYRGWNEVGMGDVDEFGEWFTTAENVFLRNLDRIAIPPVSEQKRMVDEARQMEKMLNEKFAEKERRYKQKEWLNEAHIRNSKHRLSNEVMPVRMSVERLREFFIRKDNGIKLSDIIGEKNGETVSNLLDELYASVIRIENEIENLTRSEQAGEPEQTLDVATFLNNYCSRIASTYGAKFRIEKIGFENKLQIRISPKTLIELLNNIVNNAVRHGFVKDYDNYVLQITIEATDNGMCRISLANNGEPMSERARAIYFEHGNFAGDTGHTGIGGSRIYEICYEAGGQALTPYGKDGFPVVISVEFPLI